MDNHRDVGRLRLLGCADYSLRRAISHFTARRTSRRPELHANGRHHGFHSNYQMAMGPRRGLVDNRFAPQSSALRHIDKHSNRHRDSRASRDVRVYADSIRITNAMNNESIEQGVAGYPPQGVGSPER